MATKTEAYEALKAQIEELEKQRVEAAKEMFTEASAGLFEKFPGIGSFSWNQYTPYFNDGDECNFGVNCDSDCIDINGVEKGDALHEKGLSWRDRKAKPGEYAAISAPYDAVAEFLSSFSEDDLESMFSDHVTVTVTREGTTTEEYDHE